MRVKRYEVGAVPQGNPANEDYFISIRRDNRDITQWDLPLPDAHTIVDELNELQAEVERLEKEVWRMKMLNGIEEDTIKGLKAALKTAPEWEKVLEAIENNARLEAENRELKAEVERLRKAGDVLADKAKLAGCNECFGMFNALEDALDAWNAAKEGKQS